MDAKIGRLMGVYRRGGIFGFQQASNLFHIGGTHDGKIIQGGTLSGQGHATLPRGIWPANDLFLQIIAVFRLLPLVAPLQGGGGEGESDVGAHSASQTPDI